MIRLPHSPPVSWWHVIVELERNSYTHGAMAVAIDISRSAVESWKNRSVEPRYLEGNRLIELWCEVTGKELDELPRQQGVISAAKISQPARYSGRSAVTA